MPPINRRSLVGAALLGITATACSSPRTKDEEPAPPDAPHPSDNARLQSLIEAHAGGTVVVPAGRYEIDLDSSKRGLLLNYPGTVLDLSQGVTLALRPQSVASYSIIEIGAPDCSIISGTIIGDLDNHLGNDGQWGFGVKVGRRGDRAVLRDVHVSSCWGDGIYVNGAPRDIEIRNCTSLGNRRNGLSIVDARRPLVHGGEFGGNLNSPNQAPASGIDVEPDVGQRVTGAVIEGAIVRDCAGYGVVASTHGGPTTDVVVRGVKAQGCKDGFIFVGAHLRARAIGCVSSKNLRHGFAVGLSSTAVLEACETSNNGESGFSITSPTTRLTRCSATGEPEGFAVDSEVRHRVKASDCKVDGKAWLV